MADREIQNLHSKSSKLCLLSVKRTCFENLKEKRKWFFDYSTTLSILWRTILQVRHKTNNLHIPHKLIVSFLSWLCETCFTSRHSGNSGPGKRKINGQSWFLLLDRPGYFSFPAVKYFPIFGAKLAVVSV